MKKIELNGKSGKGKFVLIDNEDFDLVNLYKWYFLTNGYVYTNLYLGRKNGKNIQKHIYIHRLIMNPEKRLQVDHANKNKLDNRKSNLRVCTGSENSVNKFDLNKNKSGFKGVSFYKWGKRKKRWRYLIL